jgi:hypothetical protein
MCFQENDHWENCSHCDNEEALHSVERKTSSRNKLLKEGVVLPHWQKEAASVRVVSEKISLLTPMEDRPHYTNILGRWTARSSVQLSIFSSPVLTEFTLPVCSKVSMSYWPNSKIRKIFSFVSHVRKPLVHFHPVICIMITQCMDQSLYLQFPLFVLQNAMRETSTLSCRLCQGLCEGL